MQSRTKRAARVAQGFVLLSPASSHQQPAGVKPCRNVFLLAASLSACTRHPFFLTLANSSSKTPPYDSSSTPSNNTNKQCSAQDAASNGTASGVRRRGGHLQVLQALPAGSCSAWAVHVEGTHTLLAEPCLCGHPLHTHLHCQHHLYIKTGDFERTLHQANI